MAKKNARFSARIVKKSKYQTMTQEEALQWLMTKKRWQRKHFEDEAMLDCMAQMVADYVNEEIGHQKESGNEWYTANVDTEKRDAAAFTIMPKVYEKYIEHAEKEGYDEDWPEGIASDSYRIAEAMMKERKIRHD